MKTGFGIALGALAGVGLCIGTLQLLHVISTEPNFPAYGGEDDFSLRFNWLAFVLVPGFIGIGGWVGLLMTRHLKRGLYAVGGALLGTVGWQLLVMAVATKIESLQTQFAANTAAVLSMLLWLVAVGIGVYFLQRLGR